MTREIVFESSTRRLGTNFGFVGEMLPGEALHVRLQNISGGPGVEVISTGERWGWTLMAISDHAGEFARLRGRDWFFDPLWGFQILLPFQTGIRIGANPVTPVTKIFWKRAKIPAPIDRTLRIRETWSGVTARWEACADARHDLVLATVVTFKIWVDLRHGPD